MEINPTVARHLNEAMAELRSQRREIDAAIEQLNRTIEALGGGETHALEAAHSETVSAEIAPPMKEAILAYMADVGRDVTTAQVGDVLAERYGWSKASVRSLMSKLAKEAKIGNPRRGVYNMDAASTPGGPHASEAPDAVGLSGAPDEVAPSTARGGDELDETPHHSGRPLGKSPDDHSDDRASVVR